MLINIRKTSFYWILTIVLAAPLAFSYVMGPDNRLQVSEAEAKLSPIRQTGMVRISGEEFVSGLLTGRNCDVVISAGHAAIYWQDVEHRGWRKGEMRGEGRFYFNPDPTLAHQWQDMQLVASGYQDADNVGEDEHDWSIFRIDQPLTRDCDVIPLRESELVCETGLIMPGFHFDRPKTRLLSQDCSLKQSMDNGIIVHDCDSKDGSSGAPLYCRDGDKLSLLGINISGVTKRDYYDAGVYGKSGRTFDDRNHKNFGVSVHGEFYRALKKELTASVERKQLRGD